MAGTDPVEIVFYIHGVSSSREGRPHTDEYRRLHQGIASTGKADTTWPKDFGGGEWGWNFDGGELQSHRALTQAQTVLGHQVFALLKDQWDLTVNPARLLLNGLRDIMFFGFGDIFYYMSADGKWAVRHEIATQILRHIEDRGGLTNTPISLTLTGHSAGSVIAFDFLYYVFSRRRHRFFRRSKGDATMQGMQQLRQLAKQGKLRLRRLVTLGSPISLVAFRSDAVVEIIARGERLRPEDYGLTSTLVGTADLPGARWINIWDKDDPIAWPIAPLMDSELAQDAYVDVSDSVAKAHNAYWDCRGVHDVIAGIW